MTISAGRALEKIARLSLCVIAFLIPVVAFPWTTEVLEFNKYIVFTVFAVIGGLAWVGSMVADREVRLKTHWYFAIPAFFVFVTALSSAFSIAPFTSWLGEGAQEYVSFLSTLLLFVFFIVGANVLSDVSLRRDVLSAAFLSSGFIGLAVLFAFFGVSLGYLANPVGVPTSLGLYFLVMAVLGNGVWMSDEGEVGYSQLPAGIFGGITRGSIILTSIAALLLLVSLDSLALWILTFIGLTPIFAFVLALPKDFSQPLRFVFPMLLFVSALLFVFIPGFLRNPYPVEVSPSAQTSLDIARQSLDQHSWLLGSGPGTYAIDYSQFTPLSVNNTVFWDTRFDRAQSYFLTILTTQGILGALTFLAFIVSTLFFSARYLLRSRAHGGWKFMYGPFSAWIVLAAGSFLFAQNMTLLVLFMVLSALLAAQMLPDARDIAFAKSPRMALVSAFVFMLLTVAMLLTLFVSLSRYSAEIAFAQGVAKDRAGASMDEIIPLLNKAATRNRWSDLYYRNLGNALLVKAGELVQQEGTDAQQLQAIIASAINAGLQTTNLAPNTVMNWELRGTIYREFSSVVQNANDFALSSFLQAITLAPNNPKYQVGLARTYIVRADLLNTLIEGEDEELGAQAEEVKKTSLEEAKKALEKAISLKSDYVPASYYLAFVEERQGNLAEAVRNMEVVKATDPNDVGVGIQLALLYLRQGKNDLAKTELERLLTIAPTFANARWYLSVIYEEEGEIEKAIQELEEIQKTDETNTEKIAQRLERLRNGQTGSEEEIPEPIEEIQTEQTEQTNNGTP